MASTDTTIYKVEHIPSSDVADEEKLLQSDPRYVSDSKYAEDPPNNTLWTIVAVMKAA